MFFFRFFFWNYFFFRVGGFSAFWLLWLLRGFLWLLWLFISHHLHSQFLSVRILCIASSAFWLFGFLAFGGFLALAVRILMLSQLVFGLVLHHQHRKFLSGPPATPFRLKCTPN